MLLDYGADIHDDDVSNAAAANIINCSKKAPLKQAIEANSPSAFRANRRPHRSGIWPLGHC